jgi:hypothetical protein
MAATPSSALLERRGTNTKALTSTASQTALKRISIIGVFAAAGSRPAAAL